MRGVLEIVIYRLNPAAAQERFLAESERVTAWLERQGGYQDRELLVDEGGQWVDLVRWDSLDDALAAADDLPNAPELGPFLALVDPESIRMMHVRPATAGAPTPE